MTNQENTFIQQTMHYLLLKNAFVGNILQELTVRTTELIPTAALSYNKNLAKFEILLNLQYLKDKTLDQRVAIFSHEILHFTHSHIFRFQEIGKPEDQMIKNIAADIAINQYLTDLPEGCVQVDQFKNVDGSPFPLYRTMEIYFDLLQKTGNKPQNEGEEKESKARKGKSANWDQVKNFKEFDKHDWDDLDDGEKQRMLNEAKNVLKRTVEKVWNDYSLAPESVKDLLQEIDSRIKKLNYRGLLKYAIKRTLSANNRTSTWYRPNKRYGVYAPGTTNDKLPAVNMYMDMSGSISHTEANEFLQIINGFLGVGLKRCNIGFWHTSLYKFRKYRQNEHLTEDDIESGGTNPLCVLDHIKKNKPNLSIILTDGCYDKSNIKMDEQIIWIISKDGTLDHPYKHIGLTIQMSKL